MIVFTILEIADRTAGIIVPAFAVSAWAVIAGRALLKG
jgi:hypothetical protein